MDALSIKEHSLFYWLKLQTMINLNMVESVQGGPLRQHPDNPQLYYSDKDDYQSPFPFSEGRGWVYTDCITGPSYPVIVYDGSQQVNPSLCVINYRDCTVLFDDSYTPKGPVTVDFWYYYVSLMTEFPYASITWDTTDDKSSGAPSTGSNNPYFSDIIVPIVTLSIDTTFTKPFQLGGGEIARHACFLDVFATNPVERNTIGEGLRGVIVSSQAPLINFSLGFPLNDDGTFNTQYDSRIQNVGRIYVDTPILSKVKIRTPMEVDRYRAQVSFNAWTYGFPNAWMFENNIAVPDEAIPDEAIPG